MGYPCFFKRDINIELYRILHPIWMTGFVHALFVCEWEEGAFNLEAERKKWNGKFKLRK